jgi:hypothetical protein
MMVSVPYVTHHRFHRLIAPPPSFARAPCLPLEESCLLPRACPQRSAVALLLVSFAC